MADLRAAMLELDLKNVQTYIQSGNIIFNSPINSTITLSEQIANKIFEKFGFDVPVITLTVEEIQDAVVENPMIDHPDIENNKMHITFLSDVPRPELQAFITRQDYSPELFYINKKVIYLYCPVNYGNTKLSNNYFENKLKVRATTRNWNTVNKLLTLASDMATL